MGSPQKKVIRFFYGGWTYTETLYDMHDIRVRIDRLRGDDHSLYRIKDNLQMQLDFLGEKMKEHDKNVIRWLIGSSTMKEIIHRVAVLDMIKITTPILKLLLNAIMLCYAVENA